MTETHSIFFFFFKQAVSAQEWVFQPEACVLRPKCAKKCQLSWVDCDKMLTFRSKSAITFLISTLATWNLVFWKERPILHKIHPFLRACHFFEALGWTKMLTHFRSTWGAFLLTQHFLPSLPCPCEISEIQTQLLAISVQFSSKWAQLHVSECFS